MQQRQYIKAEYIIGSSIGIYLEAKVMDEPEPKDPDSGALKMAQSQIENLRK